MPFPGSQEDVATDLRQVTIAHWLHNHILVGTAHRPGPLRAGPFIFTLRNGNWGNGSP
ncbi:MAG: hypothetical protein IPG69_05000 [Flavobacteriales bacterium]|nr:hypothetical protein [Flavobacteriales bacterium]